MIPLFSTLGVALCPDNSHTLSGRTLAFPVLSLTSCRAVVHPPRPCSKPRSKRGAEPHDLTPLPHRPMSAMEPSAKRGSQLEEHTPKQTPQPHSCYMALCPQEERCGAQGPGEAGGSLFTTLGVNCSARSTPSGHRRLPSRVGVGGRKTHEVRVAWGGPKLLRREVCR